MVDLTTDKFMSDSSNGNSPTGSPNAEATKSDGQPTTTPAPTSAPVSPPPIEPLQSEQTSKPPDDVRHDTDKPERKPLSRSERWTIGLAIAGIIVAAGTGVAVTWQAVLTKDTLKEIKNGGADTHTLAYDADIQAGKMSDVSTAADKIRQAADNMVTQDQRIADNAQHSLDASNRQSKAALDASIEASHLDQRAWLNVSAFKLSEEPGLDHGATVTLFVFNSGKTPALEMTNESTLIFSNIELPPTDVSFEPNPVSRSIVPPGTTGTFFKTNPLTLKTLSQASAYGSGLSKIYVEAIIHYKDTFGRSHWTKVCAWHVSGAPPDTFLFCEHGNETDQSN